MGWRKPTRDDFSAALSDPEIRAFGQNDDADDRAIAQLIANTVATVRGYIRAGRRCRLSADETLLPDMLVAPAMDLAAWNLLKRFNRVPNDARRAAWESARDLLNRVAAGSVAPEDFGEEPGSAEPVGPVFNPRSRALGRQNEYGL